MIAKLKSCNSCTWTTWIHISYCTSISNMRLEKKIRLSISNTCSNTFRIISKIDCSIFDSLKWSCWIMLIIKHSILPTDSRTLTEGTWWFFCLELIPIMCILNKKLHMAVYMHMYDNRCIINNIVMKIL